jgi:hypothetical protein
MKKEAKIDKVLKRLILRGSISTRQSIHWWDYARLADAVWKLRKRGFEISKTMIKNKKGDKCAKYIYHPKMH